MDLQERIEIIKKEFEEAFKKATESIELANKELELLKKKGQSL